jgi:hypothetical protein
MTFIGGIKNSILVAKVYLCAHFAVREQYIFNRCLSADLPTESSHLHQELAETVVTKEVY